MEAPNPAHTYAFFCVCFLYLAKIFSFTPLAPQVWAVAERPETWFYELRVSWV